MVMVGSLVSLEVFSLGENNCVVAVPFVHRRARELPDRKK
jgi:hypothetical protein